MADIGIEWVKQYHGRPPRALSPTAQSRSSARSRSKPLRIVLPLALLALAAAGFQPGRAQAAVPCLGAPADSPAFKYAEPRLFVDAQSWWKQPGDLETRHLHIGACIPERETLRGTIHIDAKIQLHANPGTVYYVAIAWETGASGDHTYFSRNPGWKCPNLGNCAFWQSFDLPASVFDRAGLEGIRLRASARQPDGKEMRTSMNFQAYIENGKSRSNMTRMPYLRMKGWYTGLNYCESAYRSDVTPLPDGRVAMPWSPWLRQRDHGDADANPTYWSVRLDPDIHNRIAGTFLGKGAGSRDGLFTVKALPGFHKLMIETECQTAAGENTGVGVIPFVVS